MTEHQHPHRDPSNDPYTAALDQMRRLYLTAPTIEDLNGISDLTLAGGLAAGFDDLTAARVAANNHRTLDQIALLWSDEGHPSEAFLLASDGDTDLAAAHRAILAGAHHDTCPACAAWLHLQHSPDEPLDNAYRTDVHAISALLVAGLDGINPMRQPVTGLTDGWALRRGDELLIVADPAHNDTSLLIQTPHGADRITLHYRDDLERAAASVYGLTPDQAITIYTFTDITTTPDAPTVMPTKTGDMTSTEVDHQFASIRQLLGEELWDTVLADFGEEIAQNLQPLNVSALANRSVSANTQSDPWPQYTHLEFGTDTHRIVFTRTLHEDGTGEWAVDLSFGEAGCTVYAVFNDGATATATLTGYTYEVLTTNPTAALISAAITTPNSPEQ